MGALKTELFTGNGFGKISIPGIGLSWSLRDSLTENPYGVIMYSIVNYQHFNTHISSTNFIDDQLNEMVN